MKALVTGGAGFIGSNLVDALLDRGDEVTIIDDLSGGSLANVEEALGRGATLHEVDIRDAGLVRSVFEDERPEVVFHLAAQVDVRKSLEDPAFDARTNVEGTINVLEAARVTKVRRFVNTSTGGAIYGEGDHVPVPTPETVEAEPMSAYGQSKFCGERYVRWEKRLYGMSTVTLRYGNVFGPRQNPHGDAGVIAIFCGRALEGQAPKVFGDGTQTRDYIFVGDVVAANLLAADHADAGGEFNIGTEVESTVLDIIDALKTHLDDPSSFEPTFEPARLGELQRSCLDASRARKELGFRSQTSLADGIGVTFASVKEASAAA
jgi:UDP-glucose 4-epimerase